MITRLLEIIKHYHHTMSGNIISITSFFDAVVLYNSNKVYIDPREVNYTFRLLFVVCL